MLQKDFSKALVFEFQWMDVCTALRIELNNWLIFSFIVSVCRTSV